MKISIIIPVYNRQHTIKKCLKTVVNQSYKNIEIIVINDGSTDNSLSIINSFAEKDERITVINQENAGVEKARFNGIKAATGDFLMFVDSDDCLPLSACQKLIDAQIKTKADVVMGRIERSFFDVVKKSVPNELYNNKLIKKPELMDEYYISFFGVNIIPVNIVAKLYKKSLFDNIITFGLKHGEDLCLNMHIFPNIESLYTVNAIVYTYNYGGMTSNYNKNLMNDAIRAYDIKKSYLDKYNYKKGYKYIDIELVNFLITDLIQLYLYKSFTVDELCSYLREIFKNAQISACFNSLKNSEYYKNSEFNLLIDGCMELNNEKIVKWIQYILGNTKKLKLKFYCKRILSGILSKINFWKEFYDT